MSGTRGGIARRLFLSLIAMALAILFVSMTVGYAISYGAERRALVNTIALVEDSYLPAIERSVFTFDRDQTEILLQGLALIPEVSAVSIVDPTFSRDEPMFIAGTVPPAATPVATLALQFPTESAMRDLGVMSVYEDRTFIAGRLLRRLAAISLVGAVLIMLVAGVFYLVVDRTIVQDLRRIAAYVEAISETGVPVPREALRTNWSRPEDEIDEIARAVDEMQERLVETYADLTRTVRERETLLQELYHRTKNNMQVIVSMLRLRASRMPDNETVRVFVHEVEQRVAAMSLVHQQLYQSRDLSRLNLNNYIRELIDQIRSGYHRDDVAVEVITGDSPTPVPVSAAIPCGLAVNEMVANALEHAFPADGTRPGRVVVHLVPSPSDEVRIEVTDDGVGLPTDFSIESHGDVGLQTVAALVTNQLGGTLDIGPAPTGGVRCIIGFPVRWPDPHGRLPSGQREEVPQGLR